MRASIIYLSGSDMSKILVADGGTILSSTCLNTLNQQILDPDDIYYQWDVAISVLETDGGAEINRTCGVTLAKQIF